MAQPLLYRPGTKVTPTVKFIAVGLITKNQNKQKQTNQNYAIGLP